MLNFLNLVDPKQNCHGADPWLAGTEHSLLQYAEAELLKPRGLLLQNYGTARYLLRDPSAPRQEIFQIDRAQGPILIVETLSPGSFRKYHEIGLRQRQLREALDIDVSQTIAEALGYFNSCYDLNCVVAQLLRNVHILKVDDHSIDLSYSDPDVPLSAFVSVPPRSAPHATLRVCESLLHECMHLQLSLVEQHVSLVTHNHPILRSPWRAELRPPSGVLHGIYVFNAILEFFHRLEGVTLSPNDLEYLRRRQVEIEPELREARRSLGPTDLTKNGIALLAASAAKSARHHSE